MAEESLQVYSYVMAVLSGIIFWAGFLIFGFIARRYSVVFNKSTFHVLLMTAPSGILLYSILLILRTSFFVKSPDVGSVIQIAAYLFFLLSAVICLAGVLKFNKLIDEVTKYKEGKDEV
jgi:hypothetical protein